MLLMKKWFLTTCMLTLVLVLATSCSSDEGTSEDPRGEFKVQVTAYAAADDDKPAKVPSNRATLVEESDKYVTKFATGDVLLVWGKDQSNKYFYGELTLTSGADTKSGSFSGTLTVESGGFDDPLANASTIKAILAPTGWSSKGYSKDDTNHCYWHRTFKPFTNITEIGPYVHIVNSGYEKSTKKFTLTTKGSLIHINWTGMTANRSYTIHAYDQAGGTEYSDGSSISADASGNLNFYIADTLSHSYHFVFNGEREYAYNHSYFATSDHEIYNVARTVRSQSLASGTNSVGAKEIVIFTGSTNSGGIEIASGGAVILNGTTISSSGYAPITCSGNATINIAGTNTLTSNTTNYSGIQPGGSGTTLTIQGSGSLTVTGGSGGAGIGAGGGTTCGDITIAGGTISATGGDSGAGIGSGTVVNLVPSQCGNIIISGGSVTATGGSNAASIGTGYASKCGNITITSGATKIVMNRSGEETNYPNFIGVAADTSSDYCGVITVDNIINPVPKSESDYFTNFDSEYTDPYIWTLTKKTS